LEEYCRSYDDKRGYRQCSPGLSSRIQPGVSPDRARQLVRFPRRSGPADRC
jgi:hypothetical protein